MKLVYNKARIIGWLCKIHNTYNDILDAYCSYCKYCKRPEDLTQAAHQTAIRRRGLYHEDIILPLERLEKLMASEDKELFLKFFAAEKLYIKDMDFVTLQARQKELQKIILEAKVKAAAVDDEIRNKKAKLSQEQREWLVSNNGKDYSVTDAVDTIDKRKKRVSKADKLASQLSNLFGDDVASELTSKVVQKQVGDSVNSPQNRTLSWKPVRTEEEPEEKTARQTEIKTNLQTKPLTFADLMKKK